MSGFWLRTFASKTDKDLWIGCSIAAVVTFVITSLVGTTGFLAVWSGDLQVGDDEGYNAFFILLSHMPRWLVAFVLIFVLYCQLVLLIHYNQHLCQLYRMMFSETNFILIGHVFWW